MIRRLPIIPTILVAAAVATMIALGLWQLRRAEWKDRLLAQYSDAGNMPPITWPTGAPDPERFPLFRNATALCATIVGQRTTAGENRGGEPGYVHIVDCAAKPNSAPLSVEVGWSKNPNAKVNWPGGLASGVVAPDSRTGMRLVAASAPPGLEPSAPPSPATIRNNHRSYAFQWFAFAGIALLIYALAVRKRMKASEQ